MSDAPALHIVTGKGGTGKSTVATAIAMGLAASGRKVLLAETEDRQALASLLGVAEVPYEEVKFTGPASHSWSGSLHAQSIEPGPALIDYVTMFYSLPGAAAFLQRSGATAFVTAIAPGLRDVLITGKMAEAARRPARAGRNWSAHTSPDGGYAFDAVVVDAPPTGRIHKFLNVTEAVASVATVGKVNEHAQRIRDVIKDARTVTHLTALAEGLPVKESVEAAEQLRELGVGIASVILNRFPQDPGPLPDAGETVRLLSTHLPLAQAKQLAHSITAEYGRQQAVYQRACDVVQPLFELAVPVLRLPEIVAESLPELSVRLSRIVDLTETAVPV